ncbi:hypothetical protein DID88_003150 [Monilinia fructigena]|uniref:Suppressor of forked domain-containing protein n=1 Tax=Monilinia fructigena TaxID=38457 RepID=A0A395IUM1_9HELO|nr:hypothetical protein DID88_003150 [Monilinia fructigena]
MAAPSVPEIKSALTLSIRGKPDLYLISEEDTIYEQDILRDPGSTKPWLAYIEFKFQHGTQLEQAFVLERACLQLPRSYKLWKMYLTLRMKHLGKLNPAAFASEYSKVNALYERALILLNKMPKIWEMYLQFLLLPNPSSPSRAEPSIVHFELYLSHNIIEYGPFIVLLRIPRLVLQRKHGKGHYQLWSEMVDLLVEHAKEVETGDEVGIDVEKIIRSGIDRFADQRGKLWSGLATYWITRVVLNEQEMFFEEGITTVMTVRDFTLIFDSYAEFEESITGVLMEAAGVRSEKGVVDENADFDLDIRMMRFEQLMDRRPFLLKRRFITAEPKQSYTDAIAAIQPKKAVGQFHELWANYAKFYEEGGDLLDRKIGIERLRDLFEQAVEGCPPRFAKVLYLMYGNLEEERGLARHAMRIYERATRAVSDEDRADMFNFYITKSASNFGLPSTRPIYERAICSITRQDARDMCLKFADMEKRLGEIDRARAIYGHASQFCDPRTSPTFWSKWEAFEVQHGNEDTFKEMLRIKRSVQAQYNTDVNFIASQALARSQAKPDENGDHDEDAADAMAALERETRAPVGFVPASTGPQGGNN